MRLECRRLCERFQLDQAYFAEAVGRRRHYLGGYGRPSLGRAEQPWLSDTIVMFWHGSLPVEVHEACKRRFQRLVRRAEGGLQSPDNHGKEH